MATAKPLDIIARFRTVTTDFRTDAVTRELGDTDQAFKDSGQASKDWSRTVSQSSTEAGRGVSRGLDSGTSGAKGKARERGREIGSELAQNIGEGISGGQSDLAGTLLGTVGGVLPGLGLAAAGVGLGVSLVAGVISGIGKRRAAALAAAKKFGSDVTEAISDGVIDQADKQNIAQQALGVDNWQDAADQIVKMGKDLGLQPDIITGALAGNAGDVATVAAALKAANIENAKNVQLNKDARGAYGQLTAPAQKRKSDLDDITHALGRSDAAFGKAATNQTNTETALHGSEDAAKDAARALDKTTVAANKLAAHDPLNLKVTAQTKGAMGEVNRFIRDASGKTITVKISPEVSVAALQGALNKAAKQLEGRLTT